MRRQTKIGFLFLLPSFLVTLIFDLYPTVFGIYYAFRSYTLTTPWLGQQFVGLDNFERAMYDPIIINGFYLSFIYILMIIAIQIPAGIFTASLFNQQVKGQAIFRSLFILPFAVAPVATAWIWRLIMNPSFGALNYFVGLIGIPPQSWLSSPEQALLSLILVDCWQWIPFTTLVFLAGLQSLPVEPFEQAEIDGATAWKKFRHITLPMMMPLITIVVLIRIIWIFGHADVPIALTRGGPGFSTYFFSIAIWFEAFRYWHVGYSLALGWLLLLICIAVVNLLVPFIVRGLE